MERFAAICAVLVLVLCAPVVCSVKIGYHGLDFASRSEELDISYVGGNPGKGAFTFAADIAVPFPGHGGGKGAVGIVRTGSGNVTSQVIGPDNASSIPRELFWDHDADGDGSEDLVISDAMGRLYVLNGSALGSDVQLSSQDAVLTGLNGTLDISDISGDGISDIIMVKDGGDKLRVMEGPLNAPSGSYELELPFECFLLDAGPDLTGDGLKDLVLAGKDGGENDTLLAYDGASLSPLAALPVPGKIGLLEHGDINGDGLDDMLLLLTDSVLNASFLIIFGNGIRGTVLEPAMTWSIAGDASAVVHEGIVVSIADIDGDLSDDIILGDRSWDGGRGRVSLFYGGSELDHSTNRKYAFPDADLIGTGPTSGLGGLVIASMDHTFDMLPDIFVGNDGALSRWELPQNYPPDEPLVLRFVEPGTDTAKERAQFGERIGIRLVAKGGGPAYSDVVRVEVRSSTGVFRPSWALLKETGADTSLYTGTILLNEGTVPGRSIAAAQRDRVILAMGTLTSAPLKIMGFVGQDDPPYIEQPDGNTTAVEGREFSLELKAYDPDGDPLLWGVLGAPEWLSFQDGLLSGTPGDADVGTYELTVNVSANSKNASLMLTINVLNVPPGNDPLLVPETVLEGGPYLGRLFTDGTFAGLLQSGPSNKTWLTLLSNGTLTGVPRNRHVGVWTFNATSADMNGAQTSFIWTVRVVNADPVLSVPPLPTLEWGSTLELDLDCPDEGDGLTMYFLQGAPEGMTIDRTTGAIDHTVPYGSGKITFRAGVTDGHGASTRVDIELEVEPIVPVLLTVLPTVLKAGEPVRIDLEAAGEGTEGFGYLLPPSLSFVHQKGFNTTKGTFSLRPWNMDIGSYSVNISFGHSGTVPSLHRWEFTVVGNESFTDPYIEVRDLRQVGSSISFGLERNNGSMPMSELRMLIKGSDGRTVKSFRLEDRFGGTFVVGVPGLIGPYDLIVEMVLDDMDGNNRTVREELSIELRGGDVGGSRPVLVIFMFLMAFVLLCLLGLTGALLSVERTSYGLRTFFAGGPSSNDEVILSAIQRRPGIRFRELQDGMRMTGKELVLGLMSLTDSGHIKAVPDGTYIRFLPTVGSFVRGPLALDRSQGAILDLLKGGAELTAEELSDKSGLSERSVSKELMLLELKDAISSRGKGSEKRFFLDRKQKVRLSSWARSGKQ